MAGTTANLNDGNIGNWGGENDGIIVVKNLEGIPGGRTLDVTGFAPEVIPEGHIVIEETATGVLKPMPVSGDAVGTLPGGHTYKGHVVSTTLTSKPFVGITIRGTINHAAMRYDVSSVLAALRTALPLITYMKD
jgi:hypothetical protein